MAESSQKNSDKDEIYIKKKEQSISTISFLSALNQHLDFDKAFPIAIDAFTKYMVTVYEKVLAGTEIGTQARFDRFRKFGEDYAKITPYYEVIESNENIFRVKYYRCPFFEIMKDEGLGHFAKAFCLSDYEFTRILMPGIEFSRKHEIVQGDSYCDHTWILKKKL